MRIALIAVVLLLAACGGQDGAQLDNRAPGLNVARAAMEGGSPDLALKVSTAILAKEPRNVPALLAQGDALSALGRTDQAEATYTAALAADPGSVDARIGLGRLRLRSDPAGAQVLFLNVLEREPRNKVALNDLGIAYDLQGQHAGAQDAYRRALGVDLRMQAAEVNLALSMALSGQAGDAVRLLKPLASNPDASRRVRHDLAAALALTGDRQGAATILGADMAPEQVDRALAGYGAFGK
jgi:Flp pilus assembly protein TadD